MGNPNLIDPNLWVDLYADKLYSFALKKVFSEDLAKDLVQETFLSALQAIANFKHESSELTWLTAILKNKIMDSFRKKKLPLGKVNNDDFFEENGHWKTKPLAIGVEDENYLENKELQKILKNCINKLPELWITVFSLKYIEDNDTALICKSLGITKSNYWIIIHRSKLSLRACLEKKWI